MSIIRRHLTGNFSVISNCCLRDCSLSWKAKGLFSYIMTLPPDWKLYRTELAKHATDGKDSIKAGFDELVNAGYIVATIVRDELGRTCGVDYDVYEDPTHADSPPAGNPLPDNPIAGNPPLLNTNTLPSTDNTKIVYGEFLEKFNSITNRSFRILDSKAKRQLDARIKEGFTLAEIMAATAACSKDDYHKANLKYLTPEFITRSDKLQKYLQAAKIPERSQEEKKSSMSV